MLAAAADQAGRDTATLGADMKTLAQALSRLRFAGQDEAELARALRERGAALGELLQPLASLAGNATTPLCDALRRVLAALAEGTNK
jgi:ABC-type transporter Mla subunit MlaD